MSMNNDKESIIEFSKKVSKLPDKIIWVRKDYVSECDGKIIRNVKQMRYIDDECILDDETLNHVIHLLAHMELHNLKEIDYNDYF